MAKPFHELLADSLKRAKAASRDGIVRSQSLQRRDQERLRRSACLQPIISGWYLLTSPGVGTGESTAWYASYWDFIKQYLAEKFGKHYCLSAESSLDVQTATNIIPKQLVVITKKSGNFTISLPHQTNLLIYQDPKNFPMDIINHDGLHIMPLGLALSRVPPSFFERDPNNAEIALLMLKDPSEVTRYLLAAGMLTSASRLAGAYQHLDKPEFASTILQTMKAAGFDVKPTNPFKSNYSTLLGSSKIQSPYCARLMSMWQSMRADVIKHFPTRRPTTAQLETIFHRIDGVYVHDAYHSLSIEGYRVSEALIEKIRSGDWDPDGNNIDHAHRNALAAKGYYEAFLQVKKSIKKIIAQKKSVVDVIQSDLSLWYQALFSPSVEAGLIQAEHLAGYRNDRVFIRHSLHSPPPKEAIIDCMSTFFECLRSEENPIVRSVLGHCTFEFIHPYIDGNGRIGRFLMNVLWIAAGYPWTIVRLESRKQYLQSLEKISVEKQIIPFTQLLAKEMAVKWKKR